MDGNTAALLKKERDDYWNDRHFRPEDLSDLEEWELSQAWDDMSKKTFISLLDCVRREDGQEFWDVLREMVIEFRRNG